MDEGVAAAATGVDDGALRLRPPADESRRPRGGGGVASEEATAAAAKREDIGGGGVPEADGVVDRRALRR